MSEGLCADCIKGNKIGGTPIGSMVDTPALPAYFLPLTPKMTSKTIVISPDVFGLDLQNIKIVADILARNSGMDVWVADIFKGKPFIKEEDIAPYMPDEPGKKTSYLQTLTKYFTFARFMLTGWSQFRAFRPAIQDPWVLDFLKYIKEEYHYEKIGMIGYCWGGGIVTRIAAMEGIIDSAICVHVSRQYEAEMPNARVPIAYFIPEEDPAWKPGLAAKVESKWEAEGGRKYKFEVYPGTTHGFGSRPNLSLPKVKESWDMLMEDLLAWLKETL
ncbi:alpha/beta-hydrolase [Serendipita vermifera]|nr:alpha/beta-hydrolase [Serendipita vermifera]